MGQAARLSDVPVGLPSTVTDMELGALAPELAVLLADTIDALARTQRFCGGCIEADELLARFGQLGEHT